MSSSVCRLPFIRSSASPVRTSSTALRRRGVAVGHVHDARVAQVEACGRGHRPDLVRGPHQDGPDEAEARRVQGPREGGGLAGVRHRRGHGGEAAAEGEELLVFSATGVRVAASVGPSDPGVLPGQGDDSIAPAKLRQRPRRVLAQRRLATAGNPHGRARSSPPVCGGTPRSTGGGRGRTSSRGTGSACGPRCAPPARRRLGGRLDADRLRRLPRGDSTDRGRGGRVRSRFEPRDRDGDRSPSPLRKTCRAMVARVEALLPVRQHFAQHEAQDGAPARRRVELAGREEPRRAARQPPGPRCGPGPCHGRSLPQLQGWHMM